MLDKLLKPRLPRLGTVKSGGLEEKERKTQGGKTWRAPQKYDHYRICTLRRDKAGNLIPDTDLEKALTAAHSDPDKKLRAIPIYLLSDDLDDVLQSSWLWYNGKRLAAKSDGETVEWRVDPQTGEELKRPRTEPWKDEYADLADAKGNRLFKLHTRINFVIAAGDSRWGGVYDHRTTSRISGDQLYGSLTHLQTLTGGRLRGLPLRLVLRPMQVTPGGKPTTVYVSHVELHGGDLHAVQQLALQLAQAEAGHAKQLHAAQLQYRKMLRAPGDFENLPEQEAVATEFQPVEEQPTDTTQTTEAPEAAQGGSDDEPEQGQGESEAPSDDGDAAEPEEPAQDSAPEAPAGGDLAIDEDVIPDDEGEGATVEDRVAGWAQIFNDAKTVEELEAAGRELAKDEPTKGSPVRVGVSKLYKQRHAELTAAAQKATA